MCPFLFEVTWAFGKMWDWEMRKLLGGTEENSFSISREHYFALQANQWGFYLSGLPNLWFLPPPCAKLKLFYTHHLFKSCERTFWMILLQIPGEPSKWSRGFSQPSILGRLQALPKCSTVARHIVGQGPWRNGFGVATKPVSNQSQPVINMLSRLPLVTGVSM